MLLSCILVTKGLPRARQPAGHATAGGRGWPDHRGAVITLRLCRSTTCCSECFLRSATRDCVSRRSVSQQRAGPASVCSAPTGQAWGLAAGQADLNTTGRPPLGGLGTWGPPPEASVSLTPVPRPRACGACRAHPWLERQARAPLQAPAWNRAGEEATETPSPAPPPAPARSPSTGHAPGGRSPR